MGEPDVACWFCQGAREFHRVTKYGTPYGNPIPCPECRAEEFKALYEQRVEREAGAQCGEPCGFGRACRQGGHCETVGPHVRHEHAVSRIAAHTWAFEGRVEREAEPRCTRRWPDGSVCGHTKGSPWHAYPLNVRGYPSTHKFEPAAPTAPREVNP